MVRFDQGAKLLVFAVILTAVGAMTLKFTEKLRERQNDSGLTEPTPKESGQATALKEPRFEVNDELPDLQLVLQLKFDEGYGSQTLDHASGQYADISNARWVEGFSGSALEFDGQSFVRMADSELLRLSSADLPAFQIDLLIKLTVPIDSLPGSYQTLLSKEHDYIFRFAHGHDEMGRGRVLSSIFFAAGIDQHVNVYLPDFKFNDDNPYQGHEVTIFDLSPGIWHKLSMAYGDRVLRVFVNGFEVSKTISDTEARMSYNDLFIGSHISGIDGFIGQIDEVRIFKH